MTTGDGPKKPGGKKPSDSTLILAESSDGLAEVLKTDHGVSIVDLTSGNGVELGFQGRVKRVEATRAADAPGVQVVLELDVGRQPLVVKYVTPTLTIHGDVEVKSVEELPDKPRGRTVWVTGGYAWWWLPFYHDRECCCCSEVVAPCECKVLVQKRYGWCLFRRPIFWRRGFAYTLVFGWPAEEVKTITYCNVLNGGNLGDHIQKTVDVSIEFDPPIPPTFASDPPTPGQCTFFSPHRLSC